MKPLEIMPALTFDETMLAAHRLLKEPETNLASSFDSIHAGLAQLKAALSSQQD